MLADGGAQVADKRSNDRCCFEQFVAIVGLCRDVRDMHGAACWIFQKVDTRRMSPAQTCLFSNRGAVWFYETMLPLD